MPLSSALAPGFVRISYSGSSEPHHMILPIDFDVPPTPGTEPSFNQRGGGTVSLTAALDLFFDPYAPMYNVGTAFGIAEVYAVDPTSGVRTFIYALNVDRTGEDAINPQIALVEGVFVFKCASGKPLKIYTMEGIFAADARNIGTPPAGVRTTFVDYMLSDDNWVWGRSNSFPIAFISFTSKENDRLRVQSGFSNF